MTIALGKKHTHTQIDDELNKTISGFKALEEYLEERRLAAEAADLQEAEFLEKWHLEVKEDFPIGPSRLKLDNDKLKGRFRTHK